MSRFYLLTFAILCGLFTGCEHVNIADIEETNGSNATPELKGNLRISVSQLEQTPLSAITRTGLVDVCSRLNFSIYNLSGSRIKQTNQVLGDTDFGTTSFQLDEGTYQLVVLAHSSNGNPTMTDPAKIRFTNAQGFTDTFLYNDNITVGAEPQTRTLTLHRITSLCRFVINGDIPAGVSRMRFYYTGGSGAFNAATGLGSVNSKQDVKFDVTSGQKEFDLYTYLRDTEGTIHLKVYVLDAADDVLLEREFNISLAQGKMTIYSGDFFSGGDYDSTTTGINLNTDWDGEIKITF